MIFLIQIKKKKRIKMKNNKVKIKIKHNKINQLMKKINSKNNDIY